jgi:glycosyltransferase involved in cell wall biosynthesis
LKIKVAYLLGSLNRGGTETLLLDVLSNATKEGLDAIGVYRKSGQLEREFQETNVPFYKLSTGKNPVRYLYRLRKLLKREEISVAHAQQPIDALFARLATIGTGIKVVLTFHGYEFTENRPGLFVLKYIIKHTDRNIYVSDTQRNYYQNKYKLASAKQLVVYNGISFEKLDRFHNQFESIRSLRAEFGLSENCLLLGMVGNFNYVRDQLTVCRFLKLLNDSGVDFYFLFVGRKIDACPQLYDACVDYCESNQLNSRVGFTGARTDVPEILSQLDAFVYSTDHDTFGIAVVEAMAMGIPTFVNDWGVMKEITNEGVWANLYKTKDEMDLYNKFITFCSNIIPAKTSSENNAIFIRKQFSISQHILTLKKTYKLIFSDTKL